MNLVDIYIIAIIVVSGLISLIRGFTKEVLSIIAWLASIWAAAKYSKSFAGAALIKHYIKTPEFQIALAFVIILVACLFALAVINRFLAKGIIFTGIKGTDRSLGVLFGLARGTLLICAVVFILQLTKIPEHKMYKESATLPYFQSITHWFTGVIYRTNKTTKA